MKAKPNEKEEAIRLRKEGLSVREIAKRLGISRSTSSVWTRNVELTSEQKLCLHKHRAFCGANHAWAKICKKSRVDNQEIGKKRMDNEDWLYAFCCGLFWGEGSKNRNVIIFTNTDSKMIEIFLKFLREKFEVPEDKVKISINCYLNNGLTIEEIQQYWLDLLKLPKTAITKATIKSDYYGERKVKHIYGVCSVKVNDTNMVQQIYGSIKAYIGDDSDKWLN